MSPLIKLSVDDFRRFYISLQNKASADELEEIVRTGIYEVENPFTSDYIILVVAKTPMYDFQVWVTGRQNFSVAKEIARLAQLLLFVRDWGNGWVEFRELLETGMERKLRISELPDWTNDDELNIEEDEDDDEYGFYEDEEETDSDGEEYDPLEDPFLW